MAMARMIARRARLGIALAALATSVGGCGASAPRRPDLVVVSIDSLRADHLGCYGYPRDTSPAIDALAAEGIRFADAVSTSSWTLPAHAALFTGLFDSAHGLVQNALRLSEAHWTLAEALGAAGYRTAGFYSGPLLDPRFGFAQGFDAWVSAMREDAAPGGRAVRAQGEVSGPRVLARVEEWLGGLDERPFFLFVHLFDVHYDYAPPPGYAERFDPDYAGSLDASRYMGNDAIRADMPPRDLAHLIALYDGEIRFSDEIVGRLFERLEARGRFESAVVVVTADHGEEFFEHGRKGHRQSLFEEVLRIPLILRLPGGRGGGRVVEEQVRIIDVMPTLLSLAGLAPVPTQGRDLSPLLRGEPWRAAPALAELHRAGERYAALRSDGRKLITDSTGQVGYFDLRADPREQRPIDPQRAPAARELYAELERIAGRSRALRTERGLDPLAQPTIAEDLREQLAALGYLDPDLGDESP